MTGGSSPAALLLLADSRFPSGAHAQSAGLEAAVAFGDVGDAGTLRRYLVGRLTTVGAVDAAFAAAACASVGCGDALDLLDVLDREYDTRVLSPRVREVDRRLGRQLLRTVRAGWSHDALDGLAHVPGGAHQPIVWGVTTHVVGGRPEDASRLVLHHLTGAITSAAIRLLALDPFEVVGVTTSVAPVLDELVVDATEAAARPPHDLPAWGGALAEVLGQDHGAWTARLFVA